MNIRAARHAVGLTQAEWARAARVPHARDLKKHDAVNRTIAVCDAIANLVRMELDEFVADTRSQWAVEMGLIHIGKGVNRIPQKVLNEFDGQPWNTIIAMRNFAAHQYDDLEARRAWGTVAIDVPELRKYLTDVVLPGVA